MISNTEDGYFWRHRAHQQLPTAQQHQKPVVGQCKQITNNGHYSMSHSLSFKPDPFAGLPSQDAGAWYTKFQAWLSLNEWAEKLAKVANGMTLLLLPPASTWFDELEPAVSSDVQKLDSAFRDRFITNQPAWVLGQQLWGQLWSQHHRHRRRRWALFNPRPSWQMPYPSRPKNCKSWRSS